MIRTVIFDLDGTLLDTSNGILESVRKTIDIMGFPALSNKELLSFIGPPLRQSFIQTYRCTEEDAQKATVIFRNYYQAGAVLHAELYEGITELCQMLDKHGVKMGVATNKPQRFADVLLKKFDLERYMMSICGADEKGALSKSDLIRLCMIKIGALNKETVLIGDTENDANGASQAGIQFLAVTYGFGFKEHNGLEKIECMGIADTPVQIAGIILNKMNGG